MWFFILPVLWLGKKLGTKIKVNLTFFLEKGLGEKRLSKCAGHWFSFWG
jgi:hypothetical protein